MSAALTQPCATVRVMLCDDSPTARTAMGRVLEMDPQVRVVARAGDGRQALEILRALPAADRPDVLLLDLEMPVMDGMTVLPLLLKAQPRLAIIVASALSQKGAEATMAAMRAGAADYIPKPTAAGGGVRDPAFQAELLAKVKGWARMRTQPSAPVLPPTMGLPRPAARVGILTPRPRVLAVGSSTGGPQALATFVRALRGPVPVPIVMVQHMPAGFTAMLADHLGRLGGPPAAEAKDGETLLPGRIYLAPGDKHLLIENNGGALVGRLNSGPPENFCRPAVDPTLRSLVTACEGRVTAVILTGMGSDGMLGCKAVAAAGGTVLAQDEASSVVWGMPGAVARAGLAQALLPPEQLAERVMGQFSPTGAHA
jgi:two-component system chemotaxis response regulator CheB